VSVEGITRPNSVGTADLAAFLIATGLVALSSDGVTIQGWYVPSQNRAAVITYPGRHSAQRHAQFLARQGYGVLLLDRRGQGGSEGDPNSYGWDEHRDIAGSDRVPARTA
jgi:predicted acyl esterase